MINFIAFDNLHIGMSDETDNTDYTTVEGIEDYKMGYEEEIDHLLDPKDIEYVKQLSKIDNIRIDTIFEPILDLDGNDRDDLISLCSITPEDAKNSFTIEKWEDGRYTEVNNLDFGEYEDLIQKIRDIVPL